ncbi:hypothetical protein OH76DRAFT_1410864 [Lentinus brumalis]|uniref:Uncharacterized protein n=1 Tax=Lentinus brumalis TaxID=2498619 RepID=A0A371CR68_9APHY|nr:hypothetical protein OH76DRAFT_1410864 [Polyporus brumalis]
MFVTSLLAVVNSRRSISDQEAANVFETGSFGLDVFNPRQNTRSGDHLQSSPFIPCTLENSVVDIRLPTDGYLDTGDM